MTKTEYFGAAVKAVGGGEDKQHSTARGFSCLLAKKQSLFFTILVCFCSNSLLGATSLIPDTPSVRVYNYFCTWAAQGYLYGQGEEKIDWSKNKGSAAIMHEKWLTEGADAWLKFYPSVRGELWFLLDDGYNTWYNSGKPESGYKGWLGKEGMEIDPKKFPSCANATPGERQKILSKLVKDAGWFGLGLWSRGWPGEEAGAVKVDWSKEAGVGYWKIDTGDWDMGYVKLRKVSFPGLILEYADNLWKKDGKLLVFTGNGETEMPALLKSSVPQLRHKILRGADVVRIYDIDQPLSQITGLLRVAGILNNANGDQAVTAIINAEDQVSIGAGLGCSFGIFRHPVILKKSGSEVLDMFNSSPRHTKKRMDEVVRAVRWHRVAPPIPANATTVAIDEKGLADTWSISDGETWDGHRGPIAQSAPARVARGLPLPEVACHGDPPFVLACRHPQGPVTVTTLGRHSNADGYKIPLADVKLDVGALPPVVGIFGRYKTLTLKFSESVESMRVFAQDIAAKSSEDITSGVTLKGNELVIPGELIAKIGLSSATPGDESDPGMALCLRKMP